MIVNNQKGSLVLQGIIAIAIFGAVTGSIVRLLQMQNNLSVKTTEEFEMVYFVDEVRGLLSNPKACLATLGGKKARSDRDIQEINQLFTDKSGQEYTFPIFEISQVFKETKNYQLKLKEIKLQQHNNEVRVTAGTTGLHFEIEFINKLNKRVKILERSIKVFITINEGEKITSCYTINGIGLGKNASKNNSQWISKAGNKGHLLRDNNLLISTTEQKGTLSIGGALQLMDTNTKCTLNNQSSLRFSKSSQSFEICNSKTRTWENIEKNSPLIASNKDIRVSLPLRSLKTYRKYRLCSIKAKSFDGGECHVSVLEDGRWEIAITGETSNFGNCEATCFN